MIEIIWHGRGGQGAFTAARLLGAASSLDDGTYGLAFPSFGPERRGAPMRAYTKVDTSPIGDRSAIEQADYVIYLDDTLFGEGWQAELKEGARVLVNAPVLPEAAHGDARVIALDANAISEAILGRPIPNTVFLGALTTLMDGLTMENVKAAIGLYMPAKLAKTNCAVVEAAAEAAAGAAATAADDASASGAASAVGAPLTTSAPELSAISDALGIAAVAFQLGAFDPATRPEAPIPALAHDELDPADYAHNTCYTAGHLDHTNAGWRNERPVIDADACTGCLQCYLYCPDGAIFKREGAAKGTAAVAFDYGFCKGCGMCVRACKFGALSMMPEEICRKAEEAVAAEGKEGAR